MKTVGFDFGTSNTVVSVNDNGKITLIPLEENKTIIPSVIFFNYETHKINFGNEAIQNYVDGHDGRLLRSLKSVLGTSLINEKTLISNKLISLNDILVLFFKEIKKKIDSFIKDGNYTLILGRPVFFVDNNEKADQLAEEQLKHIAVKAGFKEQIIFKTEPIAATAEYAEKITKEEICLVADIGGGTSDFSITHLFPTNQQNKILANHGVHIGGTNLDTALSLSYFMPTFGYHSELKKGLKTPNHLYHTLATWHRIHSIYSNKTKNIIDELINDTKEPSKIMRLQDLIKGHSGHKLAIDVEKTKINLSKTNSQISYSFDTITQISTEDLNLSNQDFILSIKDNALKMTKTILETIKKANLKPENIQTLVLTGGTSNIPYIQNEIKSILKEDVKVVNSHPFSAVASGLTL